MRDTRLDILILAAVLIISYMRPCFLTQFFNTLIGRVLLLAAIVALSVVDTLWGVFGVLVLVSFREGLVEGLTTMESKTTETETEQDVTITSDGAQPSASHSSQALPAEGAHGSPASESKATKAAKAEAKGKVLSNADWQKANCKDNKVMFEGSVLNMDEITKKFPDLEFTEGVCNPCLSNCAFKITTAGARVDAEETLRAKNSNSMQ
jgi:hypothetical protein